MTIRLRLIIAALVAAVAAAGTLTAPAVAEAKSPCWKRLLDDWVVDGRIDKAYPATCYSETLKRLPRDLDDYSSVREDINRALLTAARGNGGEPPRTIEPQVERSASDPLPGVETAGGIAKKTDGGGLFDTILPRATGADSVPLPLLVLAGLALLLLAAAGVSFAARRVQAHRAGGGGTPRA